MQDILDTIENSLYGMGEVLGGLTEDSLIFIGMDGIRYTINVARLGEEEG